ncbi:DUF2165 family protein [Synoicihabitans lomoniglobus]|uniref:DUF2165 domain-containing protein n=1 Tax=Synoicihabitans lomoniglobus TaxID=2909285 RepID=A0AAF0CRG1_9BACT|nr:DUF2165 domain-containing protein [Opitutaceae bacterium LMO-M01]WED66606.1 DUF2165 domain-containing protein [Opitutaceae bacterium LMO-M01]
MTIRLCKIALVAAVALFLFIVVLNNAFFDYASNYGFVEHVLAMDSLFSGESQVWRALRDPTPGDGSWWFYHAFYVTIILWEAVSCALCTYGAFQLFQQRRAPVVAFRAAKKFAVLGLTLSMLQWFVAFITVGGEWFLMWQSSTWNGQDAAFRMFACIGIVLLFLAAADGENESDA